MKKKAQEKLSALVVQAVAARAEYNRRYAAMKQIEPYLDEAIRASDAADTALQDFISELAGQHDH